MESWKATVDTLLAALSSVTPAQWCQAYFVFAASSCLALAALPSSLRGLFLDYGARSSNAGSKEGRGQGQEHGWLFNLVTAVTSWTQVPHSWFTAFYGLSLALSLFWLYQYGSEGTALRMVATAQARNSASSSISTEQVALAWAAMALQAARRMYEQVTVMKPSASKMWVVHWLVGLGFYIALSVAVWVEGSEAVINGPLLGHTELDAPSLKTVVAVPAILFAWVNQHRCHKQLAALKKYSMPGGGLFRWLVCPHYACECLFYLSLALAAAPAGQLCNTTLLTALLFVAVNLGVTAATTRRWYVEKFGAGAVEGKWNMIPFVF